MKLLILLVLSLFSFMVFAEDGVSHELKTIVSVLGPFLSGLIIKYPLIAKIIAFMGIARGILKPLMSMVLSLGANFPELEILKKLKGYSGSKLYKSIAFLLDYSISIKLPKK